MKAYIIAFLCMVTLSAVACTDEGYQEIREGRTAEVYACGNWQAPQLEQIDDGIADINSRITLATGAKPFHFAGLIADEETYDKSDIGDGRHCIYMVYDDYPTAYGRSLWNDYKVKQHKGGLFDENDDIVLFSSTPDGSCHVPGTPEGWPCTWAIQGLIEHELGHAFGLEHAPEGSGQNLASKPESVTWTDGDTEQACSVRDCL